MRIRYLIDPTALLRVRHRTEVANIVAPLLMQGSLATCAPALLKAMYSTKAIEYDQTLSAFQHSMKIIPLDDAACTRAVEVQLLACRSQHRTAKASDLLIAAIAESRA